MAIGHYVKLAGYWFRIEAEPEELVLFLRYDLEHNTTPAAEVHTFLQACMETQDGMVSPGPWRSHEVRVRAMRWDAERELLRLKVERAGSLADDSPHVK